MLPKRQRLSRMLFPNQKDRKTSWAGKSLRIHGYLRDGDDYLPRFAVVVPKNKSTGAVSRNVFKREVMRVIRENMQRFMRLPYKKYVIFPKEHLRSLFRDDIARDIGVFTAEQQKT